MKKSKKGGIKKTLLIISSITVLIISFLLFQRHIIIQNKLKQYAITTEYGVESLEFIEIGGIQQAILIRGNNVNNPIILDLHGGPGYPNMPTYSYKPEWEEYYTIVYFDQRLAGKTYYANDVNAVKQTDNIDIRVDDVIEISEYLIQRFGKEKIVLHATSWGTVLGINAIAQRPDLFSAYIANSQVVNQYEANTLVYNEIIELAKQNTNIKDIDKLIAMQNDFPTKTYSGNYYDNLSSMRKIAQKYVGKMSLRDNGLLSRFWPQFYSPYYTIKESTYFLKYTNLISEAAAKYMVEEFDMRSLGLQYEVPTYFISGDLDYITPTSLVEEVFVDIDSPIKDILIFDNIGHGIGYYEYSDFLIEIIRPMALKEEH